MLKYKTPHNGAFFFMQKKGAINAPTKLYCKKITNSSHLPQ
ncbi:hypothetical protein SynTAK9802_01064 [Synechococcus sp. TAK9802]|nr:hypothetical protein SynTAK9802_01064 [Synechococcus sp. TAK9802]